MKIFATALLASCVLAQAPLPLTPVYAAGSPLSASAKTDHAPPVSGVEPARKKTTVRKDFREAFDVAAAGELRLDNRHGDIDYRVVVGSRVTVEVEVIATAATERKAQSLLDEIDVRIEGSPTRVSAETEVLGGGNVKNVVKDGNRERGFEVNYTVTGPAGFALLLGNSFGDVRLSDLTARAELDVSYGDLEAGDLGPGSRVEVSFGKGVVGYVADVDARVQYGGLELRGAGRAKVRARFSNLTLGRFGELELDTQYGEYTVRSAGQLRSKGGFNELRVDSAERVTLEGNYNDVEVGYLATAGDFEVGFGDVRVRSTSAGFEAMDFEGSYTDVTLVVAEGVGYTLDAETAYGDVDYPAGMRVTQQVSKGQREGVRGEMGEGGEARVTLRGSFGDFVVR